VIRKEELQSILLHAPRRRSQSTPEYRNRGIDGLPGPSHQAAQPPASFYLSRYTRQYQAHSIWIALSRWTPQDSELSSSSSKLVRRSTRNPHGCVIQRHVPRWRCLLQPPSRNLLAFPGEQAKGMQGSGSVAWRSPRMSSYSG
jgi:hypothetical protein